MLWIFLWVGLPKSQQERGQRIAFFSRFREVGSSANFWYILGANLFQVTAFAVVFTYLAAYLIKTYAMSAGETALPLTVAGLGVVVGAFVGGRVAGHTHRLLLVSAAFLVGGLMAVLVFTTGPSPWATVAFASGVAGFLLMSWPVTATLLTDLAGRSRATALGLFAVSNQAGTVVGVSIGGLMLALGGFSLVGVFCLGAAVITAGVMRLRVRESAEFAQRMAT